MWMTQHQVVNEFLSTDACLVGIGGLCGNKFFHCDIPKFVLEMDNVNIAHFEMWAIIVALKLWKSEINGHRFVIGCDNQAVVAIINTGRSRDCLLQTLLRELTFVTATNQWEIVARYISTSNNLIPDLLSRWSLHVKYQHQFAQLRQWNWMEEQVDKELYWTTRMNILCGNSLGSKTNKDVRMYT